MRYVKLGAARSSIRSMGAAPALISTGLALVYSIVSKFIPARNCARASRSNVLSAAIRDHQRYLRLIHKRSRMRRMVGARRDNRIVAGMVRHSNAGGECGSAIRWWQSRDGARGRSVTTRSGGQGRSMPWPATATRQPIEICSAAAARGRAMGRGGGQTLQSFAVRGALRNRGQLARESRTMILFRTGTKGFWRISTSAGAAGRFPIYLITQRTMADGGRRETILRVDPGGPTWASGDRWDQAAAAREGVLDEVERRRSGHSRSHVTSYITPAGFATDLKAISAALSASSALTQSAGPRPKPRRRARNFIWSRRHPPGAGIPGVVGSAKATAGLMIEDLAR